MNEKRKAVTKRNKNQIENKNKEKGKKQHECISNENICRDEPATQPCQSCKNAEIELQGDCL